jgi:hypothetical protein
VLLMGRPGPTRGGKGGRAATGEPDARLRSPQATSSGPDVWELAWRLILTS